MKMKESSPLAISISRMLGSGAAYIGQLLAKKLNIFYLDREILSQAAKEFSLLEEDLEEYDEKTDSLWKSFLQRSAFSNPYIYTPPKLYMPTARQLFEAEADIIERTAKERSAVIIGRCASHILRQHPSHVSIFLHSDIDFRKGRVQKLYNLSEKEALKMITKIDLERSQHYHEFTGDEWKDATQYDLSIDTGKMGVEKSSELILKYIELRFGRVPTFS
jgi:cytidylate kinase